MTLHYLEIFVAICLEGSITRAAERLHISQPTVSVALRQMEEQYGGKLFDRISHKLYITPLGESIYEQARTILELWDDLNSADRLINKLRIGTGTAIGKLLLPSIVKSFMGTHPELDINITVGDATRISSLIMENALDFVIAESVVGVPGLSKHAIQRYPVVAVCHKDNPLSGQALVTAQDLARENLLLRENGSSTRQIVDLYFHNHNIDPIPLWESSSVQTLLNATKENLGISFLSLDHVLAHRNPELVILNIPDFHEERYVNLFYHKNKFFTPSMKEFIEFYTSVSRKMLEAEIQRYQEDHPGSSYCFPSF